MNKPHLLNKLRGKAGINRTAYTRLSRGNKYFLTAIYLGLCVLIVGMLYSFGSRIRTRSLPVGGIQLSTTHTKYLVGEDINFSVKNNYNSSIYITNNCPAEPLDVYKFIDNKWVRQHDTANKKECSSEQRQVKIPAGSTVTGSFKPWEHLFSTAGRYRIVAYVEYYDALPYQDIEIINKPTIPPIPTIVQPKTQPNANTSSNTGTNTTTNKTSAPTSSVAPSATTVPLQSKTISLSSGTVVVEYNATTVFVKSITPAPGYTYEGGGSGRSVEITFKKNGSETQLQLTVSNGQLTQRIE